MSEILGAIKAISRLYDYNVYGICNTDVKYAIEALQEKAEREKGCEYCSGEHSEYQHTHTTKLYINTLGKARTLVTECNPCPPYANCCAKDHHARSAFIINYCPNCGRKLN